MKKFLFLLLILACASCSEDTSIDPTLMPEATSEGRNTFGCLLDGWVYTSGRFGLPQATSYTDESALTLENPVAHSTCPYTGSGNLGDGEAFITRNDGKVISGTFQGEDVTQGRFDIRFTEEDEEGGATIAFLSQKDGLSLAKTRPIFRKDERR